MKRLTLKSSDGTVSQPISTTIEEVFYRLAEYEDTGLTPAEIEKIKTCRNKGEWIPARSKEDYQYLEICSICNYVEKWNIEPDMNKSMPFCPNCGSYNQPPKDRSEVKTYV